MRKSYLALAVPAFLLGYFFSPTEADAVVVIGGCNQNCIGRHPGHCQFYYQPFFCIDGAPIECHAQHNEVCEVES